MRGKPSRRTAKERRKPEEKEDDRDRDLVEMSIQATEVSLDFLSIQGSVILHAQTILPDRVVLRVTEALCEQKNRGVPFPELYLRLKVKRESPRPADPPEGKAGESEPL